MTETTPDYQQLDARQCRNNRASKLAYSIEELTAMLFERLWNKPEYEDMKDRCLFMATIDACNAAASELSELIG